MIVNDLPQPLTGSDAATAVAQWNQDRACTNVSATPSASIATTATETSPAPSTTVQQLSVDAG